MKKLLIIGLLFGFCIAGCYSLKTATKQVAKAGAVYPELIAANCAAKFPVVAKEGKPVIQYIPAENSDYTGKIDSLSDALNWMRSLYQGAIDAHQGDTSCQNTIIELQKRYDSLFRSFMEFKSKYIPCKPDTLKIFKTDTIPDLAAIAVRDAQISSLIADRDKWKQKYEDANGKAKKRLWYLIGIGVLGAGYVVLKLKRILP